MSRKLFELDTLKQKQYNLDMANYTKRHNAPYTGSDNIFHVGKYKGRAIRDIISEDYDYVCWCIDNIPALSNRLTELLGQRFFGDIKTDIHTQKLANGFTYDKKRRTYTKYHI